MYRFLRFPLAALLFVFALPACDSAVDAPPEEDGAGNTLRALAQAHEVEIGAAAATGLPTSDARYGDVLGREFGLLAAENAMKFGPLQPTQGNFSFREADALVDFAEAHDMRVRGHALVWHNQNPSWLTNGNRTREQMMDILRTHITTVVTRYADQIDAWDVVNEAVNDDGSLRETIWSETIGPEYIELAFRWAHEADPDARLFYNDYGAEGTGRKSDAVYALAQNLLQEGVPIHGVGLQMHVSTDWAPRPSDVAANMARLGDLGLEVQITEMDVRMPLPPTDDKELMQAGVYADMLDVCLDAWNCTAFVLWGFTDRHSWVPSTFNGQGAALIFDEDYVPKYAYTALQQVLERAD